MEETYKIAFKIGGTMCETREFQFVDIAKERVEPLRQAGATSIEIKEKTNNGWEQFDLISA